MKGNPEHAEQLKNGYVSAIKKASKPGQTRDLSQAAPMPEQNKPVYETA